MFEMAAFTNHQARHWLARPALWLLLQADDQQKQQHRPRACCGDKGELSRRFGDGPLACIEG
jgi:hypothetical protein